MINRRQDERVTITSTAKISVIVGDSVVDVIDGLIMNISRGGAQICTSKAINVSNEIQAALKFTNSKGEAIEEMVQGRVAWHAEMPPFFVFGVKFKGLNQEDHPGLLDYLQDQENEGKAS